MQTSVLSEQRQEASCFRRAGRIPLICRRNLPNLPPFPNTEPSTLVAYELACVESNQGRPALSRDHFSPA